MNSSNSPLGQLLYRAFYELDIAIVVAPRSSTVRLVEAMTAAGPQLRMVLILDLPNLMNSPKSMAYLEKNNIGGLSRADMLNQVNAPGGIVIGHEIGHALGFGDPGDPKNQENLELIENPLRAAAGIEPRRYKNQNRSNPTIPLERYR